MTERLYFADPYLTRFQARVVERLTWKGKPAVVLDRTAFYPEGGGQPPDHGTLDGVRVTDVQVRPEDGAVVHVLDAPLDAERVEGVIDWDRRFDHMQQHTAQHILSQAFLRVANAETVSVHFGPVTCTLDLAREVDAAALEAAEELANRVIEENREVRAHWVDEATLARWKVRRPPKVSGLIRVVEVADFDRVPCGGTHVRRTGEIGLVAVLRGERYKGGTRVTFVAGRRARADYRERRALLAELGRRLSAGESDLTARVERLLADQQALQARLRWAEDRLWSLEAAALWDQADVLGDVRLVVREVEAPIADVLRQLAARLRDRGPVVALLGWRGAGQARLLFVMPPGLALHAGQLLRGVLAPFGGRGGGRPEWAEGALPIPDQLPEALAAARAAVLDALQE